MVRKGGFEPPRLSAPPPQDGVSASSTTSAGGKFPSFNFCKNRQKPAIRKAQEQFSIRVFLRVHAAHGGFYAIVSRHILQGKRGCARPQPAVTIRV